MRKPYQICLPILLVCLVPAVASAQSFRVQCPTSTITHPAALNKNNVEPPYPAPTVLTAPSATTFQAPSANVNGAIKCQQVSGGDGYATMADGTQTFMFSFGPLSGLADMANGLPATQFPNVFNTPYLGAPLQPGDPATTDGASDSPKAVPGDLTQCNYNGAVGQVPDLDCLADPSTCAGVPTSGPFAGIDGHVDPRQMMDIGGI